MHINKIASTRAASKSDSDKSVKITRRKKAKTGVLSSNKSPRSAHDRYHGVKRYCVIYKKTGITECKYSLNSAEDCTGVRTKRSIKDGMGGKIGSRTLLQVKLHPRGTKRKPVMSILNQQRHHYLT